MAGSRPIGKRVAMMTGLSLMLIGTLSIWLLYDPRIGINQPDFVVTQWLVGAFGTLGLAIHPEAIKVGVLSATLGLAHVIGTDNLMSPGIGTRFDGPQFHDILVAQRNYGDVLEKSGGNDAGELNLAGSVATATDHAFEFSVDETGP